MDIAEPPRGCAGCQKLKTSRRLKISAKDQGTKILDFKQQIK